MSDLPRDPVTFLFTDVEGSTRLLERFPQAYGAALLRHDAVLRSAVEGAGGRIFETIGDGVYAVFAAPSPAATAALRAQVALQAQPWGEIGGLNVRMALHTGEVEARGSRYFGPPLYRCARILALVHGQQVVLSEVTAGGVRRDPPPAVELLDLGEHRLRDLTHPERLFQLVHPELRRTFPPLRPSGAGTVKIDARWNLVIRAAVGVARVVPLSDEVTTIGREPACTLWLDSPYASRQHARIELRPDGPWFVDLGSHNGSLINGVRVARPTLLRSGDVITIADVTLECLDQPMGVGATQPFT